MGSYTAQPESGKDQNHGTLSVEQLASHKGIPCDWLQSQIGLRNESRGVAIPYLDFDGTELVVKRRTALVAKEGSYWPKATPLLAYGSWRIDDARRNEILFLVEGESDCWALWYRGIPALGIPGANAATVLQPEHIVGLRSVYLVHEGDKGADSFIAGVRSQLFALKFQGHLYVMRMPDGCKDPADLNKRHGADLKGFLDDWRLAVENSRLEPPVCAVRGADPSKKTKVGNVGSKKRVRPLPPYQDFPIESFPPVLRDYVIAAAESIGCDVALVAVPALAAVAGAIGNSRCVLLKKGWVEPAVIWSATVAESGGHKSPAYHAAVNPLIELQIDLVEKHYDEVQQFNNSLAEWKEIPKESRGEKPTAPKKPPSHVTGDTTIEQLGELLRDSPKGLAVCRDELDGWFSSFTRYKGKSGGSDRSNWLELHRAGTMIVERLTREKGSLMVRRACASVTGTIQPSVLSKALDREALQCGMGARFLMAMPPKRRRVWTEAEIPDDLADRYLQLLQDLIALPMKNVAKRSPFVIGLSAIAKNEWVKFFDEWGGVQFAAEGEQASAFAKIESYATRLALVHHVVSHVAAGTDDRKALTQPSMRAGIALARWFAYEATRIYAMLHECDDERQTRKMVEWVRSHAEPIPSLPGKFGVTVKAVQKSNSHRWPTSEDAEASLDSLVSLGVGDWHADPPRPGGGKRKRWFAISEIASDDSDDCSEGEDASKTTPSDDCSECSEGECANEAASDCRGTTSSEYPLEGEQQSSESSEVGSEFGDAWEGPTP
jgi:Protein of unknown function (DUF3987)